MGSNVPPNRAILMRLSALPFLESGPLGNTTSALRRLASFSGRCGCAPGRFWFLVSPRPNLCDSLPQSVLEVRYSPAGDGRDFIQIKLEFLRLLAEFGQLFRIANIDLGSHRNHGLVFQPGAETLELGHDYAEVADGIGTPAGVRNINHVSQHTRALNVPQELRSQSRSIVRSFNQSRYVSDHIAVFMGRVADCNDSQVGL